MSAEASALDAPSEKRSLLKSHPILMVVVLTIASFMEVLDTGIANVSLPNIAGNLSSTTEEASWVISSYLIANAVVVPLSGWLATYFGRKRFYMVCVFIFVVASFLCGIATNLEMLIFFRVLQGLGGGSLVPLEQAFIADSVPAEKRGMAFSIYGLTLVIAPIFAPTLGGWITDNYSWHWIFFINIPIGILSLFLVWTLVSEPQSVIDEREKLKKSNFKIDWVGMLLMTVGIGALTVVLDKGYREDWFESDFIVVFSIIAFVALLVGIAWELTRENPAVDLRLLANRSVGAAAVMIFAIAVLIYGTLVLVPLMAQTLLGYTAQMAGMILSPGAVVALVMMLLTGFLMKKIEARVLAIAGLVLAALALWHLTTLNLQVGYWDLAYARAFQSFSAAFLFVPITTAAFRGVPAGKINNASSLISLSVNLGGSFGIAALATFLSYKTQHHISVLSSHASEYNPNYINWINQTTAALQEKGMSALEAASYARGLMWSEIERQAGMLAFIDAFYALMIMVLCMIPLVFLFKSGKSDKSVDIH
ncbi:MAG: EmrB/QacA family drug resistance transporter [Acidobacteria bacterium]|jgi:DHA2 family multidrug resistance protein|nr:EmrB/QacA family drug resistance transporter [Acidobacteriota bacterium]